MGRNDQPQTSIDFIELKLTLIWLVYRYVQINIQDKFTRKIVIDLDDA